MAWLLRDDDVVVALEVATGFGARLRGLLGRDGVEGAILLRPAKSVHTFGMRFPIDVAFCDRDLRVIAICSLKPNRITRMRWRANAVIEAEAGAFARWRLAVGDELRVEGVP
ncbi:MAG TPA: DUF192 domain-containing protein [Acidimicrobiales bacterium]|nr:DUF192 domain-containing protein [Acidimicrobiales bacterium]